MSKNKIPTRRVTVWMYITVHEHLKNVCKGNKKVGKTPNHLAAKIHQMAFNEYPELKTLTDASIITKNNE